MGLEVVTDQLIAELLSTEKTLINPKAKKNKSRGSERISYEIIDKVGNHFMLYSRQNLKKGMKDDFSCGLIYILPSGETLTLKRYNGPSHNHYNKLEREKLGYVTHIHTATKRYLDKTGKAEGYAEATDRYLTLEEAFSCLAKRVSFKLCQ